MKKKMYVVYRNVIKKTYEENVRYEESKKTENFFRDLEEDYKKNYTKKIPTEKNIVLITESKEYAERVKCREKDEILTNFQPIYKVEDDEYVTWYLNIFAHWYSIVEKNLEVSTKKVVEVDNKKYFIEENFIEEELE